MKDIEVYDAQRFILGGKAEFTIENLKSKVSYKYKVVQSDKNPQIFFVRVAESTSFEYAGFFTLNGIVTYGKGKKGTRDANDPAIRGLLWALKKGHNGLPRPMIMFHHGRCACCGKKLNDPESVQRGIGPVCWERVMNKEAAMA